MKLEEEIQQKKFRSEYHKLGLNIIFTNNWLSSINERFFKKFGLTSQQFNILRICRGQHPEAVNVCILQSRMLEKSSNASRLVEKLRIKGLVERVENQTDRRLADVSITDKGLELLSIIDKQMHEIENILHNISEDEVKKVNTILDKLRG